MSPAPRVLPVADTPEAALQHLRALPLLSLSADTAEIQVPLRTPADPLQWLLQQPSGQRLYWSGRDDGDDHPPIAGWGFAAILPFPADLATAQQAGGRWFGGMAFDPTHPPPEEWAPFGTGFLVQPALTVEPHRVTLRLLPGSPPRLPPGGAMLEGMGGQNLSRREEPSAGEWAQMLQAALRELRSGALEKVVLSRRTRLTLSSRPDPVALLARLAAQQQDTFDFLLEVAPGRAFLGCTPERLFRRRGRLLETEALAGTRPRHADPARDAAAGAELLASEKDREEHRHVVASLEATLAPLCTSLERPAAAPQLRRLHRVQHLYTPFLATLQAGVGDGALLAALHPTPAVCGSPADLARAQIRALEPFGRGWYAGPVGWLDADGAEFAVAIRSALLWDETLWVCAGAGIVAASEPEAEWRELDAKSAQFFSLFSGAAP